MADFSIEQQRAMALAAARARAAEAEPETPTKTDWIGAGLQSITEPVVSMATGFAGSAIGGLAGMGAALIPGLRQGIGRDVSEGVQSALTYQPRTTGGKAVTGAISYPFEKLAGAADTAGGAVAESTGSPAVGAAVNSGIQALPLLVGKLAPKVGIGSPESAASIAARAKAQSLGSVKDATLAAGRAEGLVVPPSAIEGSFLGNRAEGIAGKAALNQEATLRNQPKFNDIARREAGIAPDQPISLKTLEDARTVIGDPYRQVEALPGLPAPRTTSKLNPMMNAYPLIGKTPPTPKELIQEWKSNNSTISELWKDYQRNAAVETLDKYRAARKEQGRIETDIEKAAMAAGRPDLVPALREAKVKFAKNYDVERALNVGSGDVDAAVLGRMYDASPAKYTGGLQVIGQFANAFKPWAKDAAVVGAPGVSKLEGVMSVLGMVGGHAALGAGGGLLGIAPLVAPSLMRQLMLSKAMQQPRSYGQGTLSSLLSQPQIPAAVGAGGIGAEHQPSLADLLRQQQ